MHNMVIGIEGLVGAGKTSICRELLQVIPNSILLHGGNLYRAIVYALMQAKKQELSLSNLKENLRGIDIKDIMDKLNVRLEIENMETVIYVGNKKIDEEQIQSQEASLTVSIAGKSADNKQLYAFGKYLIDKYKKNFNVIVSGRDLMRIYPELDYHIFITATLEERIRRKCIQYNDKLDKENVKKTILERDRLQKEAGYYQKYPNTIEIDVTNCKSVSESTKEVMKHIII